MPLGQSPQVRPAPTRMRCKLAEYMLAQLEQDDGETCASRRRKGGEFLDALGRGVISRRFLEDMLDITTSERRAGTWIGS